MKYSNIREETLKNKVAQDFFDKFDCTEVIRDIDFPVKLKRTAPLDHSEKDVAVTSKVYTKYVSSLGIAGRELFAQFIIKRNNCTFHPLKI